jgi:hypothetical protein
VLDVLGEFFPALAGWANFCRAYGATLREGAQGESWRIHESEWSAIRDDNSRSLVGQKAASLGMTALRDQKISARGDCYF